ncbi:hypothetical protein SLOPH_1716 [Spraguea lophii 42_110]|uniref:Ubiquitin-like protease family profile domain-containing protein n=1 Tax=Spraguea lophii (strain 42_110) TaxID=1358809 RepID=S7W7L9_SPRLO|nr:hypothetical protein SLOPH_1716 [Spraguea lophii 42_110]
MLYILNFSYLHSLLYSMFNCLIHQKHTYDILKIFKLKYKFSHYNIEITKKDYKNLTIYFNDKIINLYFELLQDYSKVYNIKLKTISSFFYTYLNKYGYNYIKTWFKEDLTEYNYIFIPVNTGFHWIFVNINNISYTIEIYNSMYNINKKSNINEFQNFSDKSTIKDNHIYEIYHFITKFTNKKYKVKYMNASQQRNGVDCGVFTLLFARCRLITNRECITRHITIHRKMIRQELMTGKIIYDIDDIKKFSEEERDEYLVDDFNNL